MVILVETYNIDYERYWIGGHPATRYRPIGIVGCWDEWLVISDWEVRRVEDYECC